MSSLQNKIDFVALVSVTRANSNGDPLNGNRPRTDLNGFGEISDVCIKRKIRNRMQDLGKPIFVQSEDRCSDGCGSLRTAEPYVHDGGHVFALPAHDGRTAGEVEHHDGFAGGKKSLEKTTLCLGQRDVGTAA